MFPPSFDAPDSYRVVALRKRMSLKENRRRFAKQHRNNAVGKVFAAAVTQSVLTPASSRCISAK